MVHVDIPVERHVLKFLVKKYGLVHEASKTSLIGKLLIPALKTKFEKSDRECDTKYFYRVTISEWYYYTKGHTIPRNTINHLSECLNALFDEAMCDFLDISLQCNRKALTELTTFMSIYGITEDDVKRESLYKVFQRHKKRREKNLSEKMN